MGDICPLTIGMGLGQASSGRPRWKDQNIQELKESCANKVKARLWQ